MSPFSLRPLNVGETLDAGFKLYTRHFRTLLAISAVVLLPLGVLQLVLSGTLGRVSFLDLAVEAPAGEIPVGFGRYLAGALGIALLGALGGLAVQAAAVRVFAAGYQGETVDWQASLRFAGRKAAVVAATTLMVVIASGAGLLLCLLPGVWLWTSWYVGVPALLVEGRGPLAALGRSFSLVKTRFWPVLGVAVLTYLLVAIAQQVVSVIVAVAGLVPFVLSAAEGANPTTTPLLAAASLASTLVSLFTLPFQAAIATVVYFDLRVRTEAYDLELMARELGAAPSSEAPAPPPPPLAPPPPAEPNHPFGLDEPGR